MYRPTLYSWGDQVSRMLVRREAWKAWIGWTVTHIMFCAMSSLPCLFSDLESPLHDILNTVTCHWALILDSVIHYRDILMDMKFCGTTLSFGVRQVVVTWDGLTWMNFECSTSCLNLVWLWNSSTIGFGSRHHWWNMETDNNPTQVSTTCLTLSVVLY